MKRKITIVGLGTGSEDELTLGAIKALEKGKNVILRTADHGVVPFLQKRGISYSTLDDLYEKSDNFDEVYRAMVDRIIEKSSEGDVVVALPGHPLVGERLTLELLTRLNDEDYDIEIIPGISRADMFTAMIKKSGPEGVKILVAPEMSESHVDVRTGTVILNIYNSTLASEIKLILLKFYPAEMKVYVSWQEGGDRASYRRIPLFELDRLKNYDHTTCLYLPPLQLLQLSSFDFMHLVEIMDILRSSDGCPWDRQQTHESLKQYLIEETYEVLDAIDKKDPDKIMEELGDLLLQVVFHARIAKERGEFDVIDVTTRICKKMIKRHTHIFGNVKVEDAEEVLRNWETIKKEEKGLTSYTQVLRDIPSNLPALMRAYKVQKKAAMVGFDWERIEDAIEKVEEELKELKSVRTGNSPDKAAEEIGDLLFAVVNVARFLKVQPEMALTATIEKFIRRFEYIEKNADRSLEEMSLEEMDELWMRAKKEISIHSDV